MLLLILYVSLALGVAFLCSVIEAVLLSITPSFIARTTKDDPPLGAELQELKANIGKPLTAILTLNPVAHPVGAAGAGAQAAVVFGNQYLGVISAILTLLILVLAEVIPKTFGATYWQQLTPGVVRLLKPTMALMSPMTAIVRPATWLVPVLGRLLPRGSSPKTKDSSDKRGALEPDQR